VAVSSHSGAVIVLTTLAVGTDAAALARTLVAERLAACVNLLPVMTSVYRWEGRVEENQECQLVIKTAEGRVRALIERLRTLHPYAVPELLVIQASEGSEEYLRWIRDSVSLGAQASLKESQNEKASDEEDEKQ
jgi:periplasmic divalent cation tolerance protein